MPIVAIAVAAVLVALVGLYVFRYRSTPQSPFDTRASWVRAGIYFCVCWLASIATGTLGRIVEQAPVSSAQRSNGVWWVWTAVATITIFVCYWGIWGRWTLHFDRPRHLIGQVLFGVLWGSATGQVFVATFDLWDRTGWPTWGVWLGTWCTLSAFQGLFHDLWWDVYVTPEHDTPWSIKRKVPASHIPNLTITLTYLAIYENRLVFVGLQALALVAASVFQRMTVPWNPVATPAASTKPAFWGLVRGCGFHSDDPDPYATQRLSDATRRASARLTP